jgi:hypothetical protein
VSIWGSLFCEGIRGVLFSIPVVISVFLVGVERHEMEIQGFSTDSREIG